MSENPTTARKPVFRATDSQRKLLKNALNNYAKAIAEAPEHPLVDKNAALADIAALTEAYTVKKAPAPRKPKATETPKPGKK